MARLFRLRPVGWICKTRTSAPEIRQLLLHARLGHLGWKEKHGVVFFFYGRVYINWRCGKGRRMNRPVMLEMTYFGGGRK